MATIDTPAVRPQIRQTDCFIGGKWIPAASGKTFDTINPATEEVIAQVAEGDAADVDAAVAAARDAFDHGPWRKMDARDRGELPVYKIDKKWHRVYPSDVRAWIESKRVNGAEQ